MAENTIKGGDDGFGLEETVESENYSLYTTYREYLLIGYSHSKALSVIGKSEDWYKEMAKTYESEIEDEK